MGAASRRRRSARATALRLLAPAALSLSIFAASLASGAGEPTFGEYQVKAAFLKNFVKFVEWPPHTRSPLTLCILGDDPFGESLRGSDDAGGGRKLEYRRIPAVGDVGGCQVVFVGRDQREAFPQILAALAGKPVLTVGDAEGMAGAGLMLSFLIEDQKVRFDANLAPARRAGLTVSSRLLGLAKTVHNPR